MWGNGRTSELTRTTFLARVPGVQTTDAVYAIIYATYAVYAITYAMSNMCFTFYLCNNKEVLFYSATEQHL